MESMKRWESDVTDLQIRAGRLAAAADTLAHSLDEESVRLKRADQVARLQELRAAIAKDVEAAKISEETARYSHSQRNAIRGGIGTIAGMIAEASNAKWVKSMSQKLLQPPAGSKPSFGTVLVCIGLGGVPDDARILPISRLARKSGRKETGITKEMQESGCRLLTEDQFHELLDKLTLEIWEGKADLPFKPRLIPATKILSRPKVVRVSLPPQISQPRQR